MVVSIIMMIQPSLVDKVADYVEEIDRMKHKYSGLATDYLCGAVDYYRNNTLRGRFDSSLGKWNFILPTPKKIVAYESLIDERSMKTDITHD